jgi:hypothetical protein
MDDAKIDAALLSARNLRRDRSLVVTLKLIGLCRIGRAVALTSRDAGTVGAPFIIEGDGSTVVTGAIPMKPSAAERAPNLLSPEAKKNTVRLMLTARATKAFAAEASRSPFKATQGASVLILQDGRLLHLSRWPKTGYAQAAPLFLQTGPNIFPEFYAPPPKIRMWSQEHDLRMGGYWSWDWVYETFRVASIDPVTGILYPASRLQTPYAESSMLNYAALNAASEISEPGDYSIDTKNGEALVWPYGRDNLETVETPKLLEVLNSHDIRIQYLEFRGALDAAITISNSDRIDVSDSLVNDVGGTGVIVEGGNDDRVVRSVVADIGETGISLKGGDRATLSPGRHAVIDSIITRYGILNRTYRPGVHLFGVGLRVEGSLFDDAPFGAIMFEGNDHVIRGNEFSHVVREAGDSGTIYAGRNLSWRGNVIEDNYFHDIAPDIGPGRTPRGIYLDDFLSGNRIEGNVFYNVFYPVYIHGGSDNMITRNFFSCVQPYAILLHNDPQAWDREGLNLVPSAAAHRAGIENESLPMYLMRYPDISRGLSPEGYHPEHNKTVSNVVAGSGSFAIVGQAVGPLDPPVRIPALACDVRGPQLSAYLTKAIANFGVLLSDRRAALRNITYAHNFVQ